MGEKRWERHARELDKTVWNGAKGGLGSKKKRVSHGLKKQLNVISTKAGSLLLEKTSRR